MTQDASLPSSLCELSEGEIEAWLSQRGYPTYSARQLLRWLVRGQPFAAMSDLPRRLREDLARSFRFLSLETVRRSDSDRGLTTKILCRLDGGHAVEAVIMRYQRRVTLCLSSQAGCPIGCPFCATGQGRFGRNLQAHEIVEQAIEAARILTSEGRQLTHIVFMGMGEPLANYDAVLGAVRRFCDPEWQGISPRRITISTSGLVPRIDRLAQEELPVNLAISLHAARDELRNELVPINRRYGLNELLPAAQRFAQATGRRVSYEWTLLAGVNDTPRDAHELASRLDRSLAHVNLIPFNPVAGTPYQEPQPAAVRGFARQLAAQGLRVTVRDTRGRDSDAACGQLRAEHESSGVPAPMRLYVKVKAEVSN
jgi:23S rRNA (adenine2503-C2)-methyltransferase